MVRTRGRGSSSYTVGESSRQGAARGPAQVILTPGPDDPSVLRLQHEHRSQAIWDGDVSMNNVVIKYIYCIN